MDNQIEVFADGLFLEVLMGEILKKKILGEGPINDQNSLDDRKGLFETK